MHNITAEDIMIPLDKYPHIPDWFTIKEAISVFFHTNINIDGRTSLTRAILVFDEEYKMLGMVRRKDILEGLDPTEIFGHEANYSSHWYEQKDDPNLLEISFEKLMDEIIKHGDEPISKVMVPVTHTVNFDDHIIKMIFEMTDQRYCLLPVLKDNVIVGVVRTIELMNEIGRILEIG